MLTCDSRTERYVHNTTDAWCNGKHVCFPSLSPMLECGFESRSGFEFSGFSMWHFLKLVVRGFLRVLRFPPLLYPLIVSASKIKLKYYDLNSVKLNSWAVPSYQMGHDMLHVISARCVARDWHTIAPWPLERTHWRQFAVQWGDGKISNCAFQCVL